MKSIVTIAICVSLASASPFLRNSKHNATSPLDVRLQISRGTKVTAIFTNKGATDLKLLKTGTILDDKPVHKVHVIADGEIATFSGIHIHLAPERLTESDYQTIPSGKSVNTSFDVAEHHNLSHGRNISIYAENIFSYALENSTQPAGLISFRSNTINTRLNRVVAAQAHRKLQFNTPIKPNKTIQKRFQLREGCTGARLNTTQTALANCVNMARKAQAAAESGPASKLLEYFKSDSNETRSVVSGVFRRITQECGSTGGGAARIFCGDPFTACRAAVVGYAVPNVSALILCDWYYEKVPPQTEKCHGIDQASAVIHETTHFDHILGSRDYGGYGYKFVRMIPGKANIHHADTYALFANAVALGC